MPTLDLHVDKYFNPEISKHNSSLLIPAGPFLVHWPCPNCVSWLIRRAWAISIAQMPEGPCGLVGTQTVSSHAGFISQRMDLSPRGHKDILPMSLRYTVGHVHTLCSPQS